MPGLVCPYAYVEPVFNETLISHFSVHIAASLVVSQLILCFSFLLSYLFDVGSYLFSLVF